MHSWQGHLSLNSNPPPQLPYFHTRLSLGCKLWKRDLLQNLPGSSLLAPLQTVGAVTPTAPAATILVTCLVQQLSYSD